MKKIVFLLVFLLGATSTLSGFEINTHQAITRCAITTQCQQQGALNLNYFIENAFLEEVDYSNEIFDGYNKTYFEYATKGEETIEDNNMDYHDNPVVGLIEAGSVLEDAVFHNAIHIPFTKIKDADGRFNNHFYSAQFETATSATQLTPKALHADHWTDAFGQHTDSITWALDDSVRLAPLHAGTLRENRYTLKDAFRYYRDAFQGTESERRKNQARLFISIGSLIHLNQDIHSPAHVRNGPHAGGDYLEIFGRYAGGFRLVLGNFGKSETDPDVFQAVRSLDINNLMFVENGYSSYQDFFQKEADWVSRNFFSQAHNLFRVNSLGLVTGIAEDSGGEPDLSEDRLRVRSTIFDSDNTHLDKAETAEQVISDPDVEQYFFSGVGEDRWFYLKSNLQTSNNTVALAERGAIDPQQRHYTMMSVVNAKDTKTYLNYKKTALKDTAIHVIPRAVAASQAFINYFFRARMQAEVNLDVLDGANVVKDVSIKNVSDHELVSDLNLLTFKTDTDNHRSLNVFYIEKDDEDKDSKFLLSAPLTENVYIRGATTQAGTPLNDSFTIEGIQAALDSKNVPLDSIDKIIVLFDGQIGEQRGLDDYNINARGLTVAYAKVNPSGKLNDTGLVRCGNGSLNNLDCPVDSFPAQDAQAGRDVTDNDNSDGHAGFSFTKISNTGVELPASATDWSCVKDNVTGLMWEVKTDDEGLHNSANMYSWYDPDAGSNGGNEGGSFQDAVCFGYVKEDKSTYCNTQNFIAKVNSKALCGVSDWRLPTVSELLSLNSFHHEPRAIDTSYFPSDPRSLSLFGGWQWTSATRASTPSAAAVVTRSGVVVYVEKRGSFVQIRLVRSGL